MAEAEEKDIEQEQQEEKDTEFKSEMTKNLWNFWSKVENKLNYGYEKTWGYSTGYRDYDELTGGLHNSELTVVAARHSMGKSSFVLNLALNLAQNNIPVLFVSYDMDSETISSRLISSYAKVSSSKIKSGEITRNKDLDKIVKAIEDIGKLTENYMLNVIPDCTFNFKKLSEEIRNFKAEHEDGVVIVDYFQLIELERKEDRYTELTNMAAAFKRLAMEIKMPLVLVSQVSKKREDEQNKRPRLSDLAECDALAQHSDNLIFIYREDYYSMEKALNNSESDYDISFDASKKGQAEIIVAKHKNGPVKTIGMLFQAEITKFKDILITGLL